MSPAPWAPAFGPKPGFCAVFLTLASDACMFWPPCSSRLRWRNGGTDFIVVSRCARAVVPADLLGARFGNQTVSPLPQALEPTEPEGEEGAPPPPPPPPQGWGQPTDGVTCNGECGDVLMLTGPSEGERVRALNCRLGVCQLAILAASGGPPDSDDAGMWDTCQLDAVLRANGPLDAEPEQLRFVRCRRSARTVWGISGWDNRMKCPPAC